MSFILVPLVLHLKKGMHFPHSGKLHRITTVFMKVKTNIIASITAFSLTRQFVILVIMYVDTFKSDVIAFTGRSEHHCVWRNTRL